MSKQSVFQNPYNKFRFNFRKSNYELTGIDLIQPEMELRYETGVSPVIVLKTV